MKKIILFLTFNFSLFTFHYSFAQCGVDRWDVKTLSDPDTTMINFSNIVKTTITDQISLRKPNKLGKKQPRLDDETTLYSLNCLILGCKREEDMDIHVVIKELHSGETMVCEIPSPHCPETHATSHYKEYLELNEWFLKNIAQPTEKYKALKKPVAVTLTGIGMYDFFHGQKGMATNGREIHPVLSMKFMKK